eukprot:TRINITY_DN161_c0_g1_i1.p2 TRINITY_DN161_c0_g1~~TRINITY_DN161_c0_g1_i1.p2  ORF type:complete len:216 (-),score=27.61 TRINITY_DN161_c0_g1_i1:78-725(-)
MCIRDRYQRRVHGTYMRTSNNYRKTPESTAEKLKLKYSENDFVPRFSEASVPYKNYSQLSHNLVASPDYKTKPIMKYRPRIHMETMDIFSHNEKADRPRTTRASLIPPTENLEPRGSARKKILENPQGSASVASLLSTPKGTYYTLSMPKESEFFGGSKRKFIATQPVMKDIISYKDGPKFRPDLQSQHSRYFTCLLYTSPSPRDLSTSRMPSSA